MIIKKTTDYELLINEDGKHGIKYPSDDLELMLASLLITAEVFEIKLQQAKEFKKELKGKDKTNMGGQIALISRGLTAINQIAYPLLNSYEDFKREKEG